MPPRLRIGRGYAFLSLEYRQGMPVDCRVERRNSRPGLTRIHGGLADVHGSRLCQPYAQHVQK